MLKNDDTHLNTAGIRRRDFIAASSAAIATAAIGSIGLPTRLFAQSAKTQKTQITFASARFFATDTMQQVIENYNKSQNAVEVSYVELPPPSSSTEVHQQLVQQLARKNGTPDVFTQDIIWIAEFAEAGWALPLDSYFGAEEMKAYSIEPGKRFFHPVPARELLARCYFASEPS
jgi:multiple sugar transport system substrate-binding protein